MRLFVLLLAFRLVSSDKLDRTYLPPPGSKYAGGSEGTLDLPLEFPKESYTTTWRPFQVQKGLIPPEGTEPTIGLNRDLGITSGPPDFVSVNQGRQRPFGSVQNKFKLPTTTISYAFTQTTTLPPSEVFETTVTPSESPELGGQQFLGNDQGNYPKNIPGTQYLPGFETQPFIQRPGGRPSIQGQKVISGRPGTQTQFIPPGYLPIEGNLQQPDQIRPGGQSRPQQRPVNQSVQEQFSQLPQSVSRPRPGATTTGSPNYGLQSLVPTEPTFTNQDEYNQVQFQNTSTSQQPYGPSVPGIPSTISPLSETTLRPGYQQGSYNQQQQNRYSGVQPPLNQQGLTQPTMTPQGFYTPTPNVQGFPSTQRPFDGRRPQIPSTSAPPQYGPETSQYNGDFENVQENIQSGLVGPTQKPYQIPGSQFLQTTSSTQGFPTTQASFAQYDSDNIQGALPGTQQQLGYQRPTQATDFQGTTTSIPSLQGGFDQSYNTLLPDGRPPGIGTKPQYDQNQYGNTNEQFPQPFGPTSRPGQNAYSSGPTASSVATNYPGQASFNKPGYSITPSGVYTPTTPGPYQEASATASAGPSRPISRPERPQAESDRNAVILSYENELSPEGYAYSFDTSNGIHADENGITINGTRAQGSYSYIGDDGKEYSVIYSADENGFLPRGDHLPTPPPIPEAIQRVIEQAQKDKEAGIYHDGSYDEAQYGHKKYQRPKGHYRPNKKGSTVVNGVDIPERSDNEYENRRPTLSGSRGQNFDGDESLYETEEDTRVPEINDVTKKVQKINKNLGSRKSAQKPTNERTMEDYYEQEDDDMVDKFGNIIPGNKKPQNTYDYRGKYKLVKPGFVSKRPQAPGSQNDNEYDEEIIKQYNEKLRPDLGISKPGMILSVPRGQTITPGVTTVTLSDATSDNNDRNTSYDLNEPGTPTSIGKQKPPKRPSTNTNNDLFENQSLDRVPYDEGLRSGSQTSVGKQKAINKPDASTNAYSEVYKTEIPDGISYNENIRPGSQPSSDKQKVLKRPGSSANVYSEVYEPQFTEERFSEGEYPEDFKTKTVPSSPENRRPLYPTTPSSDKPEKPGPGYQYIPPKNQFNQDERNRFPTRFPETQVMTTQQKFYEKSDKSSTAKPFMTPNVYGSDLPFRKKVGYTTQSPVTDEYNEYPTDKNVNDENVASPKVRPAKPESFQVNSTRRPTYPSQITTGKSIYAETTSNQGIKKRPGQINRNQYINEQNLEDEYGNMFGQRIETSTKPGSKYSFTTKRPVQSNRIPDQYNTQPGGSYETTQAQSTDTTRQPGYGEVTIEQRPGSRIPSRKPSLRPGGRPATSTSRPGINIYQPDKSVNDYNDEDFTELEPDVIRSGVPNAPFSGSTTESVDDFTSTLRPDISITRPSDYGSSAYSSTTVKPGRPATRLQNVPSTTFRPNYSIAEQDQTQIIVDEFGRPIQSGVNQQFGTTSRPQYNIPSSTTARLPSRDKPDLGQLNRFNKTFSSNEPRLGQTDEQVKDFNTDERVNGFGLVEGQDTFRPQNQRPSSGSQIQNQDRFRAQRPKDQYGVSQSTTEKVVGENFSGPKQPQRFDPKYGYYY